MIMSLIIIQQSFTTKTFLTLFVFYILNNHLLLFLNTTSQIFFDSQILLIPYLYSRMISCLNYLTFYFRKNTFSNHSKYLINIVTCFCRSFQKSNSLLLRKSKTLFECHFASEYYQMNSACLSFLFPTKIKVKACGPLALASSSHLMMCTKLSLFEIS